MIINTTIVAAQKKEPRCFVKVEVAVLGSPSLIINRPYGLSCGRMSRFGLAVSRVKGLGSIPIRLSFLFSKAMACGQCLVTLSLLRGAAGEFSSPGSTF